MENLSTFEWHARPRNYELERRKLCIQAQLTDQHPLQEITVKVAESKGRKSDGSWNNIANNVSVVDPLSKTFDGSDPLSMFAAEMVSSSKRSVKMANVLNNKSVEVSNSSDAIEPWSMRRSEILTRYTTAEKLSIVMILAPSSSSLERKEGAGGGAVSEKVKNRLEQLDDLEEGSVQETLSLTQQEYIKRIEDLNQSLIHAWNEDQRVKSLKIAIQCSKLLADISVIQFYPSKFVLITDILDTFGHLVYDRIVEKSLSTRGQRSIPETFTPDQVPESAKETCRNWFFKIASIRELIPRFYVEAAILRCYSFLTTDQYSQALVRLATMIRGIGDPLAAAYARCYLCRVGMLVAPNIRGHLTRCYEDLLSTFAAQVGADSVQNALALQGVDMSRYVVLYAPALDWVLQCVAHGANESQLDAVLSRCGAMPVGGAMLLNSVLSSFRPGFVAGRALDFARMVRELEDTGFPRHLLYRSLGLCLVVADPPEDQRLVLLNEIWKAITKLKSPSDYISCVEVWIEFVLKYFGRRELNTVLGDILKHMLPDRAFEEHYPQLQSILSKILSRRSTDFADLFYHDKFMTFIDLFQKDTVKVSVCKSVMESYVRNPRESTCDPVVTHSLMSICRTMHDSIDAMSPDDDVLAIAALIIDGLLRAVSFGVDLEQQLAFYGECRAAFCNIDPVMQFLVRSANRVAADLHRGATQRSPAGGHTRRTAAFAHACSAYSFITVPSLNGVFHRLALYLESGQVALVNHCLSQADAFFRAAVALIPSVPRLLVMADGKVRATEPILVEYLLGFVAALVVVPDCPDQGTLYILRGMLNVIQDYQWDPNADSRAYVYCSVLGLLASLVQDSLPYHVAGVDSNDALYGGDPQFISDVNQIGATLLREIVARIRELDGQASRQFCLAHILFERLIASADLGNEKVFDTAVWTWSVLLKTKSVDLKLIERTARHVVAAGKRSGNEPLAKLSKELQLLKF